MLTGSVKPTEKRTFSGYTAGNIALQVTISHPCLVTYGKPKNSQGVT
ncbi:hypothetical protein [Azohydromonas australica]|nr:hypothetical protein [Azohydromonas australica]